MSGQRITLVGVPRRPALPSPSVSSDRLRRRVAARAERLTTAAAVRQSIVSLAAIVGSPVRNQAGQQVGRLVDIVARVHGDERYPPVTGLVVRVGRRRSFIDASAIATIDHRQVRLRMAKVGICANSVGVRERFCWRATSLDHQLVDVDGVQVDCAPPTSTSPRRRRPGIGGRRRPAWSIAAAALGPGPPRAPPHAGASHRLGRRAAVRRRDDAAPSTAGRRASSDGCRTHPASSPTSSRSSVAGAPRVGRVARPRRATDALEEMDAAQRRRCCARSTQRAAAI